MIMHHHGVISLKNTFKNIIVVQRPLNSIVDDIEELNNWHNSLHRPKFVVLLFRVAILLFFSDRMFRFHS